MPGAGKGGPRSPKNGNVANPSSPVNPQRRHHQQKLDDDAVSDSQDSVQANDAKKYKFDPHDAREPMEKRIRQYLNLNSEIRSENKKIFKINHDAM